ncbi:MAG: phasin family protein [Pseudomonadota bacterium]
MAIKKTGKLGKAPRAKARRKPAPSQASVADAVQQIWLAGMGALARAQKEGPKTFEKLIRDGVAFVDERRSSAEELIGQALASAQATVGKRMVQTRDSAAQTWSELESLFQKRVESVLHQSGIPTSAEIRALARRIDQLSAHVEALAKARPASRKTAKKPARRKAAPAAASG